MFVLEFTMLHRSRLKWFKAAAGCADVKGRGKRRQGGEVLHGWPQFSGLSLEGNNCCLGSCQRASVGAIFEGITLPVRGTRSRVERLTAACEVPSFPPSTTGRLDGEELTARDQAAAERFRPCTLLLITWRTDVLRITSTTGTTLPRAHRYRAPVSRD